MDERTEALTILDPISLDRIPIASTEGWMKGKNMVPL
jgi:hypothetical protein